MLDKALLKGEAAERIGDWLKGKWQLEELIGVGGTGAVYRARHRNGGQLAIKVLHRQLSLDPKIRKRFLREGYVVNAVDLPGVVQIQDDDMTDDGCPFLVMELLKGETLAAMLERGGPLSAVHVSELARELLATLAVAHDKGVLHRDIKPENLLVTDDGTLKVLDFGLARVLELAPSSWSTDLGGVVGTAHYMPPEQARGRWDELDARSDLWAVGATLFTLLTGEHVHPAETVNESLGLAMYERARPVRSVRPDLPEPLARVVDRALAFDQDERWQSAADMRLALDDAGAAVAVAPRPRRWLALGLVVGLTAAVGLAVLWPDAPSRWRERDRLARSGEPLRAVLAPRVSSQRAAGKTERVPATNARPGPTASLPASAPPPATVVAPSASADPFASRL